MKYLLLVDESGDQGLDKIRTDISSRGADPLMTLGGVLVPMPFVDEVRQHLADIQKSTGARNLHFTAMSHGQRAAWGRQIGGLRKRVCLFGVISKKSTIGSYRDDISGADQAVRYYNKCSQYLLELVAGFMSHADVKSSDLSIVFERKNHNYDTLRAFIAAIRRSPFDLRATRLQNIDPLSIDVLTKDQQPLLSLADYTASAIYQAFNTSLSNYGVPEQRYLREVKSRFWKDAKTGRIADHGLKFITGPRNMGLDGEDTRFAMKFYGPSTAAPSVSRRLAGPPGRRSSGPRI